MQKILPALQQLAAIIAKINPLPYLDAIEQNYGRTARNTLVAVVVLVAVIVLGYNLTDVLSWAGVQ